MAMGAASILVLMTMVLVAAAAGTSVAAVSGGTIHLPSDARGVAADLLVTAMARAKPKHHQLAGGDDDERPWGECCDIAICTRSYPPLCQCFDQVERCSDACKECVETLDSLHVCTDRYWGDPGPSCHELANGRNGRTGSDGAGLADAGQAAAATMADDKNAAGGDDDEKGGDHDWARRLARGHRRF